MSRFLILQLEAPMLAFGGNLVDQHGVCREFPALSMLTGLLGNALGLDHREDAALQRLQSRLRFAARLDRPGIPFVDYHTVELGQDFMAVPGWTTRGKVERRGGGSAKGGTHIRLRHYRADASCVVALQLDPEDEPPRMEELARALEEPARPLFVGRKCCLPSRPLLREQVEAASLLDALARVTSTAGGSAREELLAQWPEDETSEPPDDPAASRVVVLTDERDWANQIHVGERLVRQGLVRAPGAQAEGPRPPDPGPATGSGPSEAVQHSGGD